MAVKKSPMARNEDRVKKQWRRYGKKFGFPECCIHAFCEGKQRRDDYFFSGSGFLRGSCCIDKDPRKVLDGIMARREHPIPFPISDDHATILDMGRLIPCYEGERPNYKNLCYEYWIKHKYFRQFKKPSTVTVIGSREIFEEEASELYTITYNLVSHDMGISTGCAPGSDNAAVRACMDYAENNNRKLSSVPLQVWLPGKTNRGYMADDINFFCLNDNMKLFAYAQLKHSDINWIDKMQGIGREYYLRNVYQIHLLDYMRTDLVICCAKKNKQGRPMGGTAIAVRVAEALHIPVLNIRDQKDKEMLRALLPLIC